MFKQIFSRSTTITVLLYMIVLITAVFMMSFGGNPPSAVFMKKAGRGPRFCLNPVTTTVQDAISQTLTLSRDSHLLVYFTGQFGNLNGTNEAVFARIRLDATSPYNGVSWDAQASSGLGGVVLSFMWPIQNVAAGSHTVAIQVSDFSGDESATLATCSLTIFVIPK